MKTFRYFFALITFVLIFSCENDDYTIEYVDTEVKTTVNGSIAPERTSVVSKSKLAFTVELDQVLSADATVYVAFSEACGSLKENASKSLGSVTLTAGTKTGIGTIIVPERSDSDAPVGGFNGQSDCISLFVSGIEIIQKDLAWYLSESGIHDGVTWPASKTEIIEYAKSIAAPSRVVEKLEAIEEEKKGEKYNSIEEIWPDYPTDEDELWNKGNLVEDPYVTGDISTKMTLLDYQGNWHNTQTKALQICLDWEGPYGSSGNDLDLYVYNNSLTTKYEKSETGDRWEGDFFNHSNDSHPDGEYTVVVSPFRMMGNSVKASLHFTHPRTGNVDYMEFEITGETSVAKIKQETDSNGIISYKVFPY